MKKIEDAVRELGGVWPSDDADAVYLYKIHNIHIALGLPGGTALYICTRTEFEECTRRLRNEPSWDDAPDWAVAKAQDSDGEWYWYEAVPRPAASTFMSNKIKIKLADKGEVVGDWRDTLRLRPEEKKAESKDDWHEHGELPPVGTVCEMLSGDYWQKVKIVGWDGGDIVIASHKIEGRYRGLVPRQSDFRPLQTERERWVAAAQQAIGCEHNAHRHMLGQLYDADLAKMPEDE